MSIPLENDTKDIYSIVHEFAHAGFSNPKKAGRMGANDILSEVIPLFVEYML